MKTIKVDRPGYTCLGLPQTRIQKAVEKGQQAFGKVPTPLHIPTIISLCFVAMWTAQQIPLLLRAIANLFSPEQDNRMRVIVMREELQKDEEKH